MELYRNLSDIPADFGPSVVTIGNFDGVHTGHTAVLTKVVDIAQKQRLTSVVVSFDPHPVQVHRPELQLRQIMGQQDRQRCIAQLGIQSYLLLNYTLEFAQQSARDFVRSTFVEALAAQYVVIGEDVHFGRNNAGNLATMQDLGAQYGFEVVTVEDLLADDQQRTSSTMIRHLLSQGQVEEAALLLGRPHRMSGEIVHGSARGRELGFPTANLAADAAGFIPADGVYAGWLLDQDQQRHPVAISVGTNPTFEGVNQRQVEAHVIGRPQEPVENFNLYGQQVLLEFTQHLRPMVAYTGVQALIEQMGRDVLDAQQALGVHISS